MQIQSTHLLEIRKCLIYIFGEIIGGKAIVKIMYQILLIMFFEVIRNLF